MEYRTLGRTGLRVSAIAFGAGPISTLMVGNDRERQAAVVQSALDAGINWFDTAATYGAGQSERSLGCALEGPTRAAGTDIHVATKVRFTSEDLGDIRLAVHRSLAGSLQRLRRPSVTLLQLHNSITLRRGDEPTSITSEDVLGENGVLAAFREVQREGLVHFLGLTGIGTPTCLRTVVQSGAFDTMQVPYHMLNPSAGQTMPVDFAEANYGNIIADCAAQRMGVFAIRLLAGGALADNTPSPHTFKTPFFPLDLYERDRQRAQQLREEFKRNDPMGPPLPVRAIRFGLRHPQIQSVIVGLGENWQVKEALRALDQEK